MRNAPDKNPFIGVSDLLSRAAPAKRNLHFLSFIIDLLLVFVASYLVFLGGMAIVRNNDTYKNNYANYENEITYYQDMVVEAHLSEYLDRDTHLLADDEDLSIKMAISQILLSYSHDNPSSPEFPIDQNPLEELQKTYIGSFYSDCFVPASFDKDYVSQFFIKYVPLHNENNELANFNGAEPSAYTITFYKRHASSHEKIRFIYAAENDSIPYLRADVACDIYKFLIRADGYTRDLYDQFVEFYTAMLSECEDRVYKAPSYQNGHYQAYLDYRQKITQATNTTLIIAIVIGYYLMVFTPMMIFKDGRSFGKIFLRLGSINVDKSEIELWKIIVRSLLSAASFIFLAFFLVLLPPFNGSSFLLYLPYITIGTFDITLLNIIIIIFVLASINGIVMLLTHEKRSLTDIIFKTITVDVTLLDEPDYDEKNETHL